MSSPVIAPFAAAFLFPSEYTAFGLPTSSDQPDIDNLILSASSMIDEFCGRTDGDGSGSLIYTSYQERIMSQSPGRNIFYLPHRPVVAPDATQQALLMASGAAATASGATTQPYYTGFLPSTANLLLPDGTTGLSAILGAFGRYAFPRRDTYPLSNDPYSYVNPLTIITLFGGPPPWIGVDCSNLDYDPQTGEIWIATGMWLERYTEVVFAYNSGYNPLALPYKLKQACADLVKNMMMRGSGTSGMRSFNLGKSGISATFDPDMIDDNIKRRLQAFVTLRVY
jgi:hypothetical protein